MNTIKEIKVSYSSGTRHKLKIKNSKDSYELLLSCWPKQTIELQEEFKVIEDHSMRDHVHILISISPFHNEFIPWKKTGALIESCGEVIS